MKSCRDETCDVRHINHKVSADALCDLGKSLEVDNSGVSGSACDDQLGLTFLRAFFHFIVIDDVRIVGNAIGNEVVIFTGDIYGRTVCKVTTVSQAHTHNGVAGIDEGEVDRCVSLRAAVRLNVCELSAEELLCSFDSEIFNHVDALASAVVTLCGVTLGILICKNGADSRHNRGRDEVLGRDELDTSLLTRALCLDSLAHLGIELRQKFHIFLNHFYVPPCFCVS